MLLFCAGVLLTGGAASVHGQSALDGFDPNANDVVRVVVVQPDGKILIGGEFTTVLGVARNFIARLNSDGTLDTAFNPPANDSIYSIAVQANGKILVGGLFNGANSTSSLGQCLLTVGGRGGRASPRLDRDRV